MSVDILPSSTVRYFVVKEGIQIKATWNFPGFQYLDRFEEYDDEVDFKKEARRYRDHYRYYDDDDEDEDEDEDMERPEPISWEQRMGDWKIVVEAEPYQSISFKANLTTWTETFGVGTYGFKVVGYSSSNRKKVVFTKSMETTIKTTSDYKPHFSSSMDTNQIRSHLGREGEGSLKLEFLISFTPVNATSANYDISRVIEAQRVAFNDPATSDIAFKFPRRQQKGGHRYLYAKKSVLRQTSPYFESMFGSGFYESDLAANLAHESRASESGSNVKYESFPEDFEDSDCDTDEEDGVEEGAPKRVIPTIVVRDGEYKTYRALLFYAETGCVYLNPLTSEYDPPDPDNIVDEEWNDFIKRNRTIISMLKDHPPFECSPKSLYRLADKLQFDHLKGITYRHIMTRLTPKNILNELFSSFTSFYDQIRIGELYFLKTRWSEVSKQTDIIDLYLAPFGKAYGPNSLKDIFEILQPSK